MESDWTILSKMMVRMMMFDMYGWKERCSRKEEGKKDEWKDREKRNRLKKNLPLLTAKQKLSSLTAIADLPVTAFPLIP